jgi:dimethylglycine dehydrogenase
VCAGLWARDVGLLVGLDLPLVHIEHQYGTIGPIADLQKFPNDFPAIIDHESTFYVRKHE